PKTARGVQVTGVVTGVVSYPLPLQRTKCCKVGAIVPGSKRAHVVHSTSSQVVKASTNEKGLVTFSEILDVLPNLAGADGLRHPTQPLRMQVELNLVPALLD